MEEDVVAVLLEVEADREAEVAIANAAKAQTVTVTLMAAVLIPVVHAKPLLKATRAMQPFPI